MRRPKVGVSIIIRDNNRVLLGRRLSKHAQGFWGLPGGHLEGGESFEACAIREVAEETGLMLPSVKFLSVVNNIWHAEKKQYVVIIMEAEFPEGQTIVNKEPTKCEYWDWFHINKLPTPLMLGIEQSIKKEN